MQLYFSEMVSPVGQLRLVAHDQALVAVLWDNSNDLKHIDLDTLVYDVKHPILQLAEVQLNEYFQAKRRIFNIPLDLQGTEFQKRAWQALIEIPFGETKSYKQQAEAIGQVKAVRAVGAANGKNPISIIVPCHRVVGANGHLVGFAGGLDKKQILLTLEGSFSL